MRTLLRHVDIYEVLNLKGITEPESHEFYLQLLTVFSGVRDFLLETDQVDQTGFWVSSVNGQYVYIVEGGGNRRVSFTIACERDISQIFIFCMFMEYGIIPHRSRLHVDSVTPKELIKIASDFLRSDDDNIPF